MQDYLQKLVIVLPATAIAMGGLLLVVWIFSRRPRKLGAESTLPVPQRSVTTQVDESLQINLEIRNKLIEEAMERVKSILSEEFRKKEATKISQEEFNNLYKKLDSRDMDAKQLESAFRIPGVASLTNQAPQTQSLPKTDSFATLWVEELKKSRDNQDSTSNKTEKEELPEKVEEIPIPPQKIPTEMEPEPEITTELGLIEATDHVNEVKSPHEVKLIQDLELYLLTASSSNLYRSMKAFAMRSRDQQTTLNECADAGPVISDYEYVLERSAEVLASLASTSSSCMRVPQVLKGGGAVSDFEWRLDIEEKDVEDSPPNTPVRRRAPSHLCRGVRFVYEDHPPALSIIDLDPELGYGWRGPEWKEKFGKYHIYNEYKGPSIYRRQKLHLASDAGVAAHYKSERVEAKRKWDSIKNRYRDARGRALLRAELQLDTHQSFEWRKRLRSLYSDSSSESGSDQPIRIRSEAPGDGADDPDRVKSMLTASSSSGPGSDESDLERVRKQMSNHSPKMEHRSPGAEQGSS